MSLSCCTVDIIFGKHRSETVSIDVLKAMQIASPVIGALYPGYFCAYFTYICGDAADSQCGRSLRPHANACGNGDLHADTDLGKLNINMIALRLPTDLDSYYNCRQENSFSISKYTVYSEFVLKDTIHGRAN